MIIELFLVLFVLAAFLIGLGYYTGDAFHAFVGFFFIFILGIMILGNQLQYETGFSELTNHTYNGTEITSSLTTNTTTYDYFTGSWARWIGFLLAFVAGAAMALQLFYWKYDND